MVKEDGYSTLLVGVRSLELPKRHTMAEEDGYSDPIGGC